jgi:hypothetical protein
MIPSTRIQDLACGLCPASAAVRALSRATIAASAPCTSIMSRASDCSSALSAPPVAMKFIGRPGLLSGPPGPTRTTMERRSVGRTRFCSRARPADYLWPIGNCRDGGARWHPAFHKPGDFRGLNRGQVHGNPLVGSLNFLKMPAAQFSHRQQIPFAGLGGAVGLIGIGGVDFRELYLSAGQALLGGC